MSDKVKDENEGLKDKSAALGNIGVIYRAQGKPDQALKYLNESLVICKRIRAMPQVKKISEIIMLIQIFKSD